MCFLFSLVADSPDGFRQFFLLVDLAKIPTCGRNSREALAMLRFNNPQRRQFHTRLKFQNMWLISFSWSAICRGAVLKGLGNDLVVNHISQYHYGFVYAPEFDAKVHQTIDRNYDQVRGVWVASHQIQWFLNRVGFISHLLITP